MIVTDKTPCFGKVCPQHKDCRRYAAVDGKPCETPAMGTCDHGDPEKTLFAKIEGAAL
jgi:hypothetical protein